MPQAIGAEQDDVVRRDCKLEVIDVSQADLPEIAVELFALWAGVDLFRFELAGVYPSRPKRMIGSNALQTFARTVVVGAAIQISLMSAPRT